MDGAAREDGPRRPLSAYMFFAKEQRVPLAQGLAKELGEAPRFTEVGKALSKAWNRLSEAERRPFEDQAVASRRAWAERPAKRQAKRAELRDELRDELKAELRGGLKAELRGELKAELEAEIWAGLEAEIWAGPRADG